MKIIKNLFIFLIVLVVIGFFIPPDLRNGYINYYYGSIVTSTSSDLGQAEMAFDTATKAQPNNVKFARAYARNLNNMGDVLGKGSPAEQYFGKALDFSKAWIDAHESDPDIWNLYVEKARAEWGLGRKEPAKESIDKAVDLAPTDYEALVYQGIIWRDLAGKDRNAMSKAVNVFEQAISVRNEQRTSWAHYELAVGFYTIKDETNALNEVNQALAQWPDRKLKQKIERLKHDIESGGRSEH
jgi:tetratricopeptide (TPR) repeat protein